MKRKPDSIITVVLVFFLGLVASGINSLFASEHPNYHADLPANTAVSIPEQHQRSRS